MPEKTRAFIFSRGTSILNEVRIEKWVYGGDGLARIAPKQTTESGAVASEGAGRVVLVPYVLPGELARIENGDDIHAALVEVLEPSTDRVTAPCQYFTRCGGCHYQHAP